MLKELSGARKNLKTWGHWSFLSPIFEELLGKKVEYVGRTSTASPATGSLTIHKKEQIELVANALGQSLPITEK